jgi:hypothetical protein
MFTAPYNFDIDKADEDKHMQLKVLQRDLFRKECSLTLEECQVFVLNLPAPRFPELFQYA